MHSNSLLAGDADNPVNLKADVSDQLNIRPLIDWTSQRHSSAPLALLAVVSLSGKAKWLPMVFWAEASGLGPRQLTKGDKSTGEETGVHFICLLEASNGGDRWSRIDFAETMAEKKRETGTEKADSQRRMASETDHLPLIAISLHSERRLELKAESGLAHIREDRASGLSYSRSRLDQLNGIQDLAISEIFRGQELGSGLVENGSKAVKESSVEVDERTNAELKSTYANGDESVRGTNGMKSSTTVELSWTLSSEGSVVNLAQILVEVRSSGNQ
ncbi:unnamed protein product [Protopolystoma xenopodis]|uniref:Uncharacterized protein n=1 Tax=Protopolystoma xenopodis TaxID=117903 RepID=A0A3S5CT12_9PLAT|nr:unnamed protein product [Protopolystoma xenopodis]